METIILWHSVHDGELLSIESDLLARSLKIKFEVPHSDVRDAKGYPVCWNKTTLLRFVLVGFSMSGKFAAVYRNCSPGARAWIDAHRPGSGGEFPVPLEMTKAWCDTQHDPNAALNTILAPFTKVSVNPELTELFLDDFGKAVRIGLEETLNICGLSFVEQARSRGAKLLSVMSTPTGVN